MSPRFEPDPSKVSSSLEIFPKDDYEFLIGEPKSFIRKNKKNQDSYGVRYTLTVQGGAYDGKKAVYTLYMHSEGAQAMAKRFQMAALGFKSNSDEEKSFNAKFGGNDWSFDPDVGSVSDMWRKFTGARVIGVLDVQPNPENPAEQQQVFKSWRPIDG